MWDYKAQDWQEEVKRSLKQDILPAFKKSIFSGQSVSPFSVADRQRSLQKTVVQAPAFLAIQNYLDLKSAGLEEWLADGDIGLRFRQLSDLMDTPLSRPTSAFLSQPFAFKLDTTQRAFLESFAEKSKLNLGWSPLSFGLTRGEILKKPFIGWEDIFSETALHKENVSWFYLSSAPYQWAGAEPHVELAVELALGHAVLQELLSLKIPIATAVNKISFGLALGTDILVESSKIVAMKLLWARLSELAGSHSPAVAEVYALPSVRLFSGRDPWNNVMRMTLMAFSSLVGGAKGFKCLPYDILNKQKSSEAIRISTNIPLILKKEAYLGSVANPLDGSSLYMESIDALCKGAWQLFQEIEKKGGVFEAVRSGWLQNEIKRSADYSKNELSYFQKELIGVNRFVSPKVSYGAGPISEIVRLSDIIDPLFLKDSDDDFLAVEPLLVGALSYDWEMLQLSSDRYFEKHGKRPKITIIKGGGPVVQKKLSWLTGLLSLGGVGHDVVSFEEGAEFAVMSPLAVAISSGDEMEETLISTLKAKGVGKIWSLSHPRESSAVDRYVDSSASAIELIKEIHQQVME